MHACHIWHRLNEPIQCLLHSPNSSGRLLITTNACRCLISGCSHCYELAIVDLSPWIVAALKHIVIMIIWYFQTNLGLSYLSISIPCCLLVDYQYVVYLFQFGGKLISFGNSKSPAGGQQQTRPNRTVFVSQVVTETDLVSRSVQLEKTLQEGHYVQFCDEKITSTDDLNESTIWSFLKASSSVVSYSQCSHSHKYYIERTRTCTRAYTHTRFFRSTILHHKLWL